MKQKKTNRVALLLHWAGEQKVWLFLAVLLAMAGGLCIVVPYIEIYRLMDAAFGADLALIEANHDVDWLRDGPYPYALQNRILGDRGHLSNEASAEFAVSLAAAGTHTLLLAHLSPENNTPERARTVVQGALERAHLRPEVGVLPRDECSLCYEV